jgi:hypothetical protein
MMKLLVVADLGRMKAYRLEEDKAYSKPRLELLDDWETGVNQHLSESLSDQAGRYRKGVGASEGASSLSDGEQHNIDLERRRRAVKALAQRITLLLDRETLDGCYLAADSRINQPILDEMDRRTRGRIQKTVAANLSKLNPAELAQHFCGNDH